VDFPFPYAGMTRIRFEETLSAAQQFLKAISVKSFLKRRDTSNGSFAGAKIQKTQQLQLKQLSI